MYSPIKQPQKYLCKYKNALSTCNNLQHEPVSPTCAAPPFRTSDAIPLPVFYMGNDLEYAYILAVGHICPA